jgi:hypothetical protein
MSSEKIYLTKEEQIYLMEMLEVKDPIQAVEKFASLMIEERADPTELKKYLKQIMRKLK